MIFNEIPFELKKHIFTYVTPSEWINTAKVSNEWLELTLGSIKKVESIHLLILDHLAEFLNRERNTNYTWVSLLRLMPRLEHLECTESTEAFWTEISSICHQLKILDFKPRNDASFDWNTLDFSFDNLTEFLWAGSYPGLLLGNWTYVRPVFPIKLLALSPKLQIIKLSNVEVNAEWQNKIPKSVKHIFLDNVIFTDEHILQDNKFFNDEHLCSVDNLCEDTSTLETFSAYNCAFPLIAASKFFEETLQLKQLALPFTVAGDIESTSMMVNNALRNCRDLKTVKAYDVKITESWRRVIPQKVKSIEVSHMNVQENIRHDFSFDWLFQNYNNLQSLKLTWMNWTGMDHQKFYSTENLKKLNLYNFMSHFIAGRDESIDQFCNICFRMICGSHLVEVEICQLTIDESWRHIFPPTIRRLALMDIHLSKEAQQLFSPQFICENPSYIESLILENFDGDLPAMNLNAFSGMQSLQKLQLTNLRISGDCLQSILTHCSALTDLLIGALTADALTNIPQYLVLPGLRKLEVNGSFDPPALLLQHFPNVLTVDITIVPFKGHFSDVMHASQVEETLEIKIRKPSWHLVRSLIETVDDSKFKYFCLTYESGVVSFYFTNSLLNACIRLNDVLNDVKKRYKVLKINNYPTSSLLSKIFSGILSSIDELSQRYHELMGLK